MANHLDRRSHSRNTDASGGLSLSPGHDACASPERLPSSASTETGMPQKITTGYKALIEAAEREIETIPIEDALKLHGRDDIVLVDLRDPRELEREGKVPGAFHCPRGMLEF